MDLLLAKQRVLAEKPILAQIIKEHGRRSVLEYIQHIQSKSLISQSVHANELRSLLIEEISARLGKDVAKIAFEYLKVHNYVTTAPHDGPIGHPFFINSPMASVLSDESLPIISLPCAGVSMGNSTFPRGFLVHDNKGLPQRIPLWGWRERKKPVYGVESFTEEMFLNTIKGIQDFNGPSNHLREILSEDIGNMEVLTANSYKKQLTIINHLHWKRLPNASRTTFISIDQETIVSKLILRHHLRQTTILHQILFSTRGRNAFVKFFDGIPGAHHTKNNGGTHFFWLLKNGDRQALTIHENELRAADGTVIPLTISSISDALEQEKIFPCMALTFMTLAFYYGLICGGGFSQTSYLTQMQQAYISLLKELEATPTDLSVTKGVPTDLMGGDFLFMLLNTPNGVVPATALDSILYGHRDTLTQLKYGVTHTSLETAIDLLIPEFYKIITGLSISPKPFPTHDIPFRTIS